MDLSNLNGTNGFRLDRETSLDIYFNSISNAGDINGDGFDDILVGAHLPDLYGDPIYPSDQGYSYVIFGKSSGFSPTINLSTLDGSNGFRSSPSKSAGNSVSSAGDINGDGFDDFIIGAPSALRPGDFGESYIVFGKASGFSATMNLFSLDGSNGFRLFSEYGHNSLGSSVSSAGDINGDGFDDVIVGEPHVYDRTGSSFVIFGKSEDFNATFDLANLDGSNGFRLDGVTEGDFSGSSVSNAGDVNGDGFDDLIVGAHGADPSGDRSGSSYVVFGKASGFSATMNLSSLNGSNGFRLDGMATYDLSGESVSTAGDVNGDGFDDLIVGAFRADPNGSYSGSSYVVFGQASGFTATMNLSSLNGSNGFRLDGVTENDFSGGSVSTAGDVNGDGFDDLIVSASGAGSSYIIFGRSDFGSTLPEILGTPGDDILKGTSAAEHFKASDGNDKLIGRGGADSFEGGAGNDKIQVADLSFASVDGGAGIDVLHLAGTGLNLNLADSGDRIKDIEIISLYSQGDLNTLTLTAADLRNLSTTTNTLKVNGNAGGHIIVEDSGWIDGGNRGGGGYYHEYTQGDAVLLVGQNLTVDFVVA
ncbi:hypothetical protein [Nitrosomonas sp.]|uniref:hypothetical protein n=1 Tax=Nitrosomonas sp. TaxID=42353 RepID=UPI003436413F